MTKPMVTIYDCETNETEIREMNAAEFKQWEADQAAIKSAIVAQADRETARQALLAKLGINDDEAKLLLS